MSTGANDFGNIEDSTLAFASGRQQWVDAPAFAPFVVLTCVAGKDERAAAFDIAEQQLGLRIADAFLARQNHPLVTIETIQLLVKEQVKGNFVLDQDLFHERSWTIGAVNAGDHL